MLPAIRAQYEAALSMLDECIRLCPEQHWDGIIGKYPFWMVAYHTLCFTDLYLEPDESTFKTHPRLHPKGMQEFDDEYPSRRFAQAELLEYLQLCRAKLARRLAAETPEVLAGPSGHARRKFSRAELHLYSMRHVQHHAGQLSAFLRRAGVETHWASSGWR
jgi:uncharacterized damage-inducible protein DinB